MERAEVQSATSRVKLEGGGKGGVDEGKQRKGERRLKEGNVPVACKPKNAVHCGVVLPGGVFDLSRLSRRLLCRARRAERCEQ